MDIETAFSTDALQLTIDRLLARHFDVIQGRSQVCAGADRIELAHFVRDREKHCVAIRRKVLDGRYTFAPYLEHEIAKPGSQGTRTISIATIRDAVVQRAVYECVYPAVDNRLTESVFGYRKGRTAHAAVDAVRGHLVAGRTFVLDADFRDFFGTVDHGFLIALTNTLPIDDRLRKLLYRFIKTRSVAVEALAKDRTTPGKQRKYESTPRPRGVPQGGVLSGLLTNLYLADFDRRVLSISPGYVRYADDFLVCCASVSEYANARQEVEAAAKVALLELHPTKTHPTYRDATDNGVNFLGFRIRTEGLSIRAKNVARFKDRIRGVVRQHEGRHCADPSEALRTLCNALAFKIRGPDDGHCRHLIERGLSRAPHRRSWIGFFRNVDDIAQVRRLDNWIRRQVSAYMWRRYRFRATLSMQRAAGLPSLVNHLYRARREWSPSTTR